MLTQLPEIKQRLYAMRNGLLADSLRRLGSPFRIIFGLNLPQIAEIARDIPPSAEIARQLRDNADSRECRLLAPMVFPCEELTEQEAEAWAREAVSPEEADILCMKLLRRSPFARAIADRLISSDRPMDRYVALRLLFNCLDSEAEKIKELASAEYARNDPATRSIAFSLLDEISLLTGDF